MYIIHECDSFYSINSIILLEEQKKLGEKNKPEKQRKDDFTRFVAKRFQKIVDCDPASLVGDDGKFKKDFVYDFEGILSMETLRKKCYKIRTSNQKGLFSKFKKLCVKVAKGAYSYFWISLNWVLIGSVITFSNEFVVFIIELTISSIFVSFTPYSFFSFPVLFWIFFSIYFSFKNRLSLILKYLLLLVPICIWIC